ncbi:MAG: hypothetical protein LH631_05995 [Alkalinema sp. CAN_BIN05]|nr:hypothetical protein [Alkalinema sp. CAN_BIN05]
MVTQESKPHLFNSQFYNHRLIHDRSILHQVYAIGDRSSLAIQSQQWGDRLQVCSM